MCACGWCVVDGVLLVCACLCVCVALCVWSVVVVCGCVCVVWVWLRRRKMGKKIPPPDFFPLKAFSRSYCWPLGSST